MPPIIRKRLSATDIEKHSCSEKKKMKVSEDKTPRKSFKSERRQSHSSPSTSSLSNSGTRVREPVTPKNNVKRQGKKIKKSEVEKSALSPQNVNDMNISQLLALGENCGDSSFGNQKVESEFSDTDNDDDDFEEVKDVEVKTPQIPKEGVSVVLQLPHMKRRSKMAVDAETHIKRELNRVKKGIQLLMHKVHVLCWIAHLKFINNVLNSPAIMKSCIVLVKSKNLYPPKHTDLNYLEGVLKWYHKNIHLQKEEVSNECTGDLIKDLTHEIEEKKVYSFRDYTFIFVAFLRILGVKARIIMSFQVLPAKPSTSDLLIFNKAAEKSNNTKKPNTEADEDKEEKTRSKLKKCINNSKGKSASALNDDIDQGSDDDFKKNKPKPKKSNFRPKKGSRETTSSDKKTDSESTENIKKNCGQKSKYGKKKNSDNKEIIKKVHSDSEDDDFVSESLKKSEKKKPLRQSTSNNEESINNKQREKSDVWAEIYVEAEEKWISVDVTRQKIHCVNELYSRATHPVLYIIACNNDSTLKDVTKRYVPHWHSDTKKKRVDEGWWNETMQPYLPPKTAQDREEDDDIAQQLHDKPLPCVISEFKDHPLYALKRHLLKFEAIYPPDAPTLGFIRGEPVYARECVFTLHSREMWYKQARVVRLKEEPYKIVKARPKYDKMTGEMKKDLPLELFGPWQTEEYIPPIAVDGKVPRNEYGNVDLFKPCMLPFGTVHLQIPALNKVARKLGIDCVPATVGFDFHSGGSHPIFDGFVVCQEFKDILLDTWNKEIDESAKRSEEKKEKRIYGNWKRLIRGLLIREKLKLKYSFGENVEPGSSNSVCDDTSTEPTEIQ